MTSDDQNLYEQLTDERENRFGWFHTPPAGPSPRVDFDLVKRVLAHQAQREKEKKPLWQFRRLFRKAA